MAKSTPLSEAMRAQTEQARSLLRSHRANETRAEIAEACDINPHWLEKFDQGVLGVPREFERIERLLSYLQAAARKQAA